MPSAIRIEAAVLDAVRRHAEEAAPDECCGLLIGRPDEIEQSRRARNATPGPTRFQIHPADHFAAIREARARDRQVVGAYHSHPSSPAVPSPTDVARSDDPEFLHVIVSRSDVRCYRIAGGGYREVPLVAVSTA